MLSLRCERVFVLSGWKGFFAMALGLLGLKVGMTQVYNRSRQRSSRRLPYLKLGLARCCRFATKLATVMTLCSLGLGTKHAARRRAGTRPRLWPTWFPIAAVKAAEAAGVAILPKANCEPQRYIREFRLETPATATVGQNLAVADVFKDVKSVDVVGTSKGRGTAGAMKRHGFQGLGASHGVKRHHRSPGSVGSHASNRGSGRPKQGKRMAGRFGNSRSTSRNLTLVRIDAENNLLLIRGAVPGPNGGLVMVRPTKKIKR